MSLHALVLRMLAFSNARIQLASVVTRTWQQCSRIDVSRLIQTGSAIRARNLLWEKTGTGPVYDVLGLPGGLSVDSRPSFFAVFATQSALP